MSRRDDRYDDMNQDGYDHGYIDADGNYQNDNYGDDGRDIDADNYDNGGQYRGNGYEQGSQYYNNNVNHGGYGSSGNYGNRNYNGNDRTDYDSGNYHDERYDDGYYGRDGYDDDEGNYHDGGVGDGYDADGYNDAGYDDGYEDDDYIEDDIGEDAGYNSSESGNGRAANDSLRGAGRNAGNPRSRTGAGAPVSTRVRPHGRSQGGRNGNGRGGGRRGSGHNKRRIVLLVVEIAALLVVVFILYAVSRVTKVGKANLSEQDIQNNISDTVKTNTAMKGYRNIALFGVDSTEGQLDQRTRSDTIIIASINQDTGDVRLVSVYRDTLLNLSGSTSAADLSNTDNYNKVNAAYAKGGPEQAINVLNTNLDMNITDFVTVGFGGLTDVVNALGGIEINVTQDEIVHLNNYQSTMAQELKMNYTEVTQPGLQTLDGLQTTAYCRIRYTRGWDYKRAARQRAVLYAIFNKASQADPAQLAQIANNAFNEIYTSMDLSTLVSDVTALANYNIQAEDSIDDMSNGFPQETARIQANLGNALGDCVIPRTLSNNVIWLHQFLFEDSSFQPSETVQTISDTIDDMTRDAVPEEMTDEDHT